MKNAIHFSPQSQNKRIDMIGISTIQEDFINDIKESKLYSKMTDEVTTINDEVVVMCFCYVESKKDILEVFQESPMSLCRNNKS